MTRQNKETLYSRPALSRSDFMLCRQILHPAWLYWAEFMLNSINVYARPGWRQKGLPSCPNRSGGFQIYFQPRRLRCFVAVILTFSMAANNLCTFKAFKRFASNANIYWLAAIVISQCPFASISKIYWLQKFKEMPFVRPCTQSIMGAGAGSKRKISMIHLGKIIKILFVAGKTCF